MELRLVAWFLLVLASLAAIVTAVSTSNTDSELVLLNATDLSHLNKRGYDPSTESQGWKQIEVWQGRMPVHIGDCSGDQLFTRVWEILDAACPKTNSGYCSTWNEPWLNYQLPRKSWQGRAGLTIEKAEWSSIQDRAILINLVAGIFRTETQDPRNCDTDSGVGHKYCNVGDIIRVNLDKELPNGPKTYMHVRMRSTKQDWKNAGTYYCCTGRERIDAFLDSYAVELQDFYNWGKTMYGREVRCIIDGYKVCTKDMD